jgi:hypothetical protein
MHLPSLPSLPLAALADRCMQGLCCLGPVLHVCAHGPAGGPCAPRAGPPPSTSQPSTLNLPGHEPWSGTSHAIKSNLTATKSNLTRAGEASSKAAGKGGAWEASSKGGRQHGSSWNPFRTSLLVSGCASHACRDQGGVDVARPPPTPSARRSRHVISSCLPPVRGEPGARPVALSRVKEALHVKARRGGPQALREREVNNRRVASA